MPRLAPLRRGTARMDLGAALLAALAVLAVHAVSSFPTLQSSNGDNDSLLRLVEVRDLLGEQGWFDLSQYRMGPDGGFPMHWSRLVDAPIAGIVLAATALTGSQATGELVALVLWPFLLSLAAMFMLVRLARLFAGEAAILPAVVVGGAALHFVAIFAPGALDHHNAQLVLTLGVVLLLAEAEADPRRAIGAGALSALMLAVGMESAPYVAIAGLWAAGAFLIRDERAGPAGFGLGFAVTALLCFVATVPSSRWSAAECDAFSAPQLSLAIIGGAGLVVATLIGGGSILRRAPTLALVGVAAGIVGHTFFPQCLGDPFAGLDPRLKTYWLNSVTEALPIWTILESRPVMAFGYYVTPLIGAAWLDVRMRRQGVRRIDLLVGLFLTAALLVSFWQVRGSMFAIPLAVIPLCGWIAQARAAAATGANGAALKMLLAWLVSINLVWAGGAASVAAALGMPSQGQQAGAAGPCYSQADYGQLAALPATTVLAVSNLGAPILRFTAHRAFAGPYHRNVEGNLFALDAFMGPPDAARAMLQGNGVTLLAHCPGNSESDALADWAPGGLMAALVAGRIPDWLEPVAGGTDLMLYRIGP